MDCQTSRAFVLRPRSTWKSEWRARPYKSLLSETFIFVVLLGLLTFIQSSQYLVKASHHPIALFTSENQGWSYL